MGLFFLVFYERAVTAPLEFGSPPNNHRLSHEFGSNPLLDGSVRGIHIDMDYFDIVSGFKKKGINLNDDEFDAIRGFLESEFPTKLKNEQRYGRRRL